MFSPDDKPVMLYALALIAVSVLTGWGIGGRIERDNPPTVFVPWEMK